jgi:LysM repeat protein
LFRPWCLTLTLALCAAVPGCSPTAETRLEETQNPHYRSAQESLKALDYKAAIASFEKAVEDNPRSALAHFELGILYEQQVNDFATALYHYNQALKLRPNEHPADVIRQRIPACRQELVKADSLAVINPSALRETESLREQNAVLRKQIEQLQAQLAARLPAGSAGAQTVSARESVRLPATSSTMKTNAPVRADPGNSSRGFSGGASGLVPPATTATGRGRTHPVKVGDTAFSIARQHQIKFDSLMAANPGLDPKRLRVGQVLNIPAS